MSGTQALLIAYTNGDSDWAFEELVTSYINFVFSAALRMVGGDRALAEDVTQAVFTDLARKAAFLPKDVQLGGWLHRHTCFVARKTLRRERRRIAREKHAIEMHTIQDYTEGNLAQLALVLDEVINDLGEEDRNAIVLRFFEERDFRSIGETLGSSEDAARMRVSRAVDKIGALLRRRGFVLTAAGISFVLSGKLATAAPTGLATRIVYVELGRPSTSAGLLGVMRETCFTRLNVGIVSAAVILAFVVLLFSGRRTAAKVVPDSDGKTFTPAEFADLAVEEADDVDAAEPLVAPIKRDVPTAPIGPQSLPMASSVRPIAVKPVAAIVTAAQRRPIEVQPTSIASVPVANASASGAGQFGAKATSPPTYPRRQQPTPYVAPRIAPAPQTFAPTVYSNSTSAPLVKGPPNSGAQAQPWDSVRTMATFEPNTPPPSPASQMAVQPGRSLQRSLNSNRANDPRKRERQP